MMFVAEFVQRLHPYCKHYKENNAIKTFMQQLLCRCYNTEAISPDSAFRYYKGIEENGTIVGDTICSFAKRNEKLYDVNSASIYIEECTKGILNKGQLCLDFADEIPDICETNYPTKLAVHLRQLLNNAASTVTKPRGKARHSDDTSMKEAESANNNGVIEAFATSYKTEMTLSTVSSGIRTEIWKVINRIIQQCQKYKFDTEDLYRSIEILNTAKRTHNEEQFASHYPIYKKKCKATEDRFKAIFAIWGELYTTFANIIEIKELCQISFSHTVITPDNERIHVAGSNTDVFIDKLRNISEDYLFT